MSQDKTPSAIVPSRLILASASPRRRELLQQLGLEFTVRPAQIDESPHDEEKASDYVLRLAREKAHAVAESADRVEGELVLAADTVVSVDDALLGKPEDEDDARRMLRMLSGRIHEVLTGVALCDIDRGLQLAKLHTTRVHFKELSDAEIDWYVATGEPSDKAGGYAIQGHAAIFVEGIGGSYSNVVGLPLELVYRLFLQARYHVAPLPEPGA